MRSDSTTKFKPIVRTHGLSHTSEYSTWEGMKQRCLNPNSAFYEYYGGRGITICPEWINSFEAFYKDMGPRPKPKDTLERINNDGNYEPKNVRWASRAEQGKNKREASDAVKITYQGETRTMAKWARHLNVPYQVLYHRWMRSPNEDFGRLCERPPRTFGEHHFAARFTEEQVKEMRLLRRIEGYTYQEIGRRYGIDRRHARNIVVGLCYKHVT